VKIPTESIIAPEKLTQYLLLPKRKNDKANFLAQAGFTLENPEVLEKAIRAQIAEHDAVWEREDAYGVIYQVTGALHGPHGILAVVTIWIEQKQDNVFRFVTLKPAR
jgi:hypothetical protein